MLNSLGRAQSTMRDSEIMLNDPSGEYIPLSCNQPIPSVGVLLPSALTESFEVAVARVVDLLHSGVSVTTIQCDGLVRGCVANPLSLAATCNHCKDVRDHALHSVAAGVPRLSLDEYSGSAAVDADGLDDDRELAVSASSTILTFYRSEGTATCGPFRSRLFRTLYDRYLAHSRFVYAAVRTLLSNNTITRIEFFNGRIVPTRGAMQAARRERKDFGVIEVSGSARRITVVHNASVHDLTFKREELSAFLGSESLDRSAGVAFYEARKAGLDTNDRSFTRNQRSGLLHTVTRPVLAVFTSSADELKVAGPQWFTDASRDPAAFIVGLAELVQDRFQLVVRMHPNQAGDKTGATEAMRRTLSRHTGILVIPPASKASSYELLERAFAVVTFGSTIGLEATYWGKPSILAGRAVWDQADVAYTISSPKDAAMLLDRAPAPKSRENAIRVGAYFQQGCGHAGSLTWQVGGTPGFAVKGFSFLKRKRASPAYWITRVADRVLQRL